jgi:hypothetical protein
MLICLFCYVLYKYLLNLKFYMLIEDDMSYLFIFFIQIFYIFIINKLIMGAQEHLTC